MNEAMLTAFVVAALAAAMPLLLTAIGETVGEQSGVLNIGLEGLMLVGAYASFAVTLASGSFTLGFLCGAVAGALLSSLMALLAVRLRASQIVVGIGLTLAGTGLTSMLYDASYADTRPHLPPPTPVPIGPLDAIPVLGPALSTQPTAFYLTWVMLGFASLWLHHTGPGLRLRAAGQRPEALAAVGGRVLRLRVGAVLFGGATAGLGGTYLALVSAGTFTPGMTHGLGFLAIVVAMLGRGRMLAVGGIALVYGIFVAIGTALQLTTIELSNDVITMAPFVVVLIVLAAIGLKRTRGGQEARPALPPALATPYPPGD